MDKSNNTNLNTQIPLDPLLPPPGGGSVDESNFNNVIHSARLTKTTVVPDVYRLVCLKVIFKCKNDKKIEQKD